MEKTSTNDVMCINESRGMNSSNEDSEHVINVVNKDAFAMQVGLLTRNV